MNTRSRLYFILMLLALPLLFIANVMFGAVDIPAERVIAAVFHPQTVDEISRFIVVDSRCSAALTALITGVGVAISGLLLQFLFRNSLAGPSVLGISSGAGVGVAIATLSFGGATSILSSIVWGRMAIVGAALVGAVCSTIVVLAVSTRLKNDVMVLVAGMMIGQIASALVALMSVMATADGLRGFVMWGMGSFVGVAWEEMAWLLVPVLLSYMAAMTMAKRLNVAMLGQNYAANLGVDMHSLRHAVLLTACLPVAVTTAFCGPIALLGLAMPHVARLSLRTDDFRMLLPATALAGAIVALACNLISNVMASGGQSMPINVLTPIVCSPIIIYIVLKQ